MNDLEQNTVQKNGKKDLSKSVLVVDDNTEIRDNFKIFFNQLGFNVIEAVNGLDAIHKLVINGGPDSFSLIITDLMMPNMNGVEFILKLKQKYRDNRTPIMVCSVKSEQNVIKTTISLGIHDYILKPVNFSFLLKKLKALFSSSQ